jgi:hypothetical protein
MLHRLALVVGPVVVMATGATMNTTTTTPSPRAASLAATPSS